MFRRLIVCPAIKSLSTKSPIRSLSVMIDFASSQDTALRIQPYVTRTDVKTSSFFDKLAGCEIFFKCENFQKTGSFKARGAVNAVGKLVEAGKAAGGVLTHSSGNHGAALAYAASIFGVPCTVVTPSNAPKTKLDGIREFGAKLVECEPTLASREATCQRIVEETGAVLIHPHDNWDVMSGQSTIGLEFLESVPDLDCILVPTGGGGMAGGIATVANHIRPQCHVHCVVPASKDLQTSFDAGKRMWPKVPGTLDTVADGMRVGNLGERCFETVYKYADHHAFYVTDDEIIGAMRMVVIEPSSGTAIAATLQPSFRDFGYKKVGVILCGGNVDLDHLPWHK